MKHKLFRLGLTVAMLAVLVESLGAPMKWGLSESAAFRPPGNAN